MRYLASLSLIPWIALATASVDSSAAIYTVGTDADGDCTHADIQAAVDAAAATAEADEIRVSLASGHAGPVHVPAGDLVLSGGYATCSATTPSGRSMLSGSAGQLLPVLRIDTGACSTAPPPSIRVDGIDVADGPDHGISVSGCLALHLSRMRISGNRALFGAGVIVGGHGAATQVEIGDDVRIEDNTATIGGGGIYAYAASLRIGGVDTLVHNNRVTSSDGFGGGIALFGPDPSLPAKATIVSGGTADDGIVSSNSAAHAAGLRGMGSVSVEAYTTDATLPVRFNDNRASATGVGGAISLVGADARMIAIEAVIEANMAAVGAAVSLADGAHFLMRSLPPSHPADAVACASSERCNRVNAGASSNGVGQGLVVAASGGAPAAPTSARFESVRILGNGGHSLFHETCSGMSCPPLQLDVVNSLIAGNATRHVLDAAGVATFTCDLCTLSGPSASTLPMFRTAGGLSLSRSVIWEPGRPLIGGRVPAYLNGMSLQLHELGPYSAIDYPFDRDIETGDPHFVNAAAGDYRPAADSPLLDRTWNSSIEPTDIDGVPRAVDLPDVPNVLGEVDIGAYERALDVAPDAIFRHDFEP